MFGFSSNRLRRLVAEFHRDQRGVVAILFTIAFLVITSAVGAAIDYGRAHSAKTRLQAAADAGALAAAKLINANLAKRLAVGETVFNANYKEHNEVTFKVEHANQNSELLIVASHKLPTYLMQLAGVDQLTIRAESVVPLQKPGYAEVVLVLDYSDSMITSDKYVRMYEAAAKMVDQISDNGANTNVKFGLVPFSAVVRADIPAANIRSDLVYDGCTMDRRFSIQHAGRHACRR